MVNGITSDLFTLIFIVIHFPFHCSLHCFLPFSIMAIPLYFTGIKSTKSKKGLIYPNLQGIVWKCHFGAHLDGHQHGIWQPTVTFLTYIKALQAIMQKPCHEKAQHTLYSQNEEPFQSKNLYNYQFLAALILKKSEGQMISLV